MKSMVVDEDSFSLDDISSTVHTTQKLTLGPFEECHRNRYPQGAHQKQCIS